MNTALRVSTVLTVMSTLTEKTTLVMVLSTRVKYNYTYLSDEHASQGDTESAETVTCQSSDNHVLKWMVCNSYQRHTQRGNFYSLRCF